MWFSKMYYDWKMRSFLVYFFAILTNKNIFYNLCCWKFSAGSRSIPKISFVIQKHLVLMLCLLWDMQGMKSIPPWQILLKSIFLVWSAVCQLSYPSLPGKYQMGLFSKQLRIMTQIAREFSTNYRSMLFSWR